jgi:hypothetical protein
MFKVEKGVSVTSKRRSEYGLFLQDLKPGDSFSKTEDGKPVTETHVASLRVAARNLGIKLVTRVQDDGNFRVWVEGNAKNKAK